MMITGGPENRALSIIIGQNRGLGPRFSMFGEELQAIRHRCSLGHIGFHCIVHGSWFFLVNEEGRYLRSLHSGSQMRLFLVLKLRFTTWVLAANRASLSYTRPPFPLAFLDSFLFSSQDAVSFLMWELSCRSGMRAVAFA